jgi:hypothetical protein
MTRAVEESHRRLLRARCDGSHVERSMFPLREIGDAEATARILEGAGFDEIRFEDVHEPVLYGPDLDAALAFVRGFQSMSAALASLSDGEAASAVERLRRMLAAHYSDERGVVLDSRSWLITARLRRYDV